MRNTVVLCNWHRRLSSASCKCDSPKAKASSNCIARMTATTLPVDGSETSGCANSPLDGRRVLMAEEVLIVQLVSILETSLYTLKLFSKVVGNLVHDQVGTQTKDTETTHDHHETSPFHASTPVHLGVWRRPAGHGCGECPGASRLPGQAHPLDRAFPARWRHGHDCAFRGAKNHRENQLEHRCR